MPSGAVISAPNPPMPPALATAAANPTGQAPAIGAIKIGTRSPNLRQNAAARSRALAGVAEDIGGLVRICVNHKIGCRCAAANALCAAQQCDERRDYAPGGTCDRYNS